MSNLTTSSSEFEWLDEQLQRVRHKYGLAMLACLKGVPDA
jgi:hypothetical protein